MNIIILKAEELSHDARVLIKDHRAKHIKKVLHAELKQSIRIGLLNGSLGIGTIEEINEESVKLSCTFDNPAPQRPKISLILAMPRPKVMKRLWAQLSAIGIDQIVIINAEKVEKYYFDSHVLEKSFYEPLLIEGLQQARCTQLPQIKIYRNFKPFVEDHFNSDFETHQKLLADPSGNQSICSLISDLNRTMKKVIAIGPEGGWNSYELEKLKSNGFQLFSFGKRILRTDTACITILGTIQTLSENNSEVSH